MSTITTTYRAPTPSPTARRSPSRGTIAAWHCGIVRAAGFVAAAELLLAVLASAVLWAASTFGHLARAEALGAAALFFFCRGIAPVGGRRALVVAGGRTFLRSLLRSTGFAVMAGIALFAVRPDLTPPVPLALAVIAVSEVAGFLVRGTARSLIRRRVLVEDCLVLGASDKAGRFFAELQAARPGAIVPVANGSVDGSCLIDYDQLQQMAARGARSRLVVVEPAAERHPDLHALLIDGKLRGLPVEEALDAYERLVGRVWVEGLRPEWLVYADGFRQPALYLAAKRALDVVAALVLLAVSFPVLVLVALAIKIESAGPVLFAQERVGHHGRTFTLFKFRSMRQDAEAQSGPVWAGENDARITPLGRVLRKCRLDELPQIWNVLRGEMSFVGPRPERPYFVSLLRDQIPFYDLRHYVRPGITGWAQVSYPYGASVEDAYQKLQYDLYYAKHASLGFDVAILLKTIRVVLLGRGAR
jgi:sugar transferase (PEP-CTERM system associated)